MSINPAENIKSSVMKQDESAWVNGASRDKLASPEVHPVVQNAISAAFAAWLATHPNDAKAILRKIAASARRREAGEQLAGAPANISE
jgi:DNA gyrase/topoisomerase IV subunit B